MIKRRDEFLSSEDLDLKNMTPAERDAAWEAWLRQAQSTNQQDQHLYSHGVFISEPPWRKKGERVKKGEGLKGAG